MALVGATGSAKTRVLQALASQGAQVLDLEHCARHKGSLMHDVNLDISGPAVSHIEKTFASIWNATGKPMLIPPPKTFPDLPVTPDGEVINVNVLKQAETPGLGTKMADEGNVLLASVKGQKLEEKKLVNGKLAVAKDGGDVDALTAATISSPIRCFAPTRRNTGRWRWSRSTRMAISGRTIRGG